MRRRFQLRRLIMGICFALALMIGTGSILKALPKLTSFGQKLGVLSAVMALPEGAYGLLEGDSPHEVTLSANEENPVSILEPTDDKPSDQEPASSESAVSDTGTEPIPEPEIPDENKAVLVHKTYTAAPSNIYIPLENGFIKNCTSHSTAEIEEAISKPPAFTIENTDEPQVLIMHTHTTESYLPFTGEYYDKTYSSRSTDNTKNMVAVGNKIEEELKKAGIGVIHDTTQHDYPSFNGAYDRSVITVQNYLKKYPSIKVVLDVHRDAIVSGDTVTAPVADVNGKTAAQVMIVNGCANDNINYPNFFQNLSFSAALENQMEGDYPGLTRPVLFDYRKYNQHLTTGSILLEVGGHGNTLEQATYSGELIGASLGKLLNSYKQ